MLPSLVTASIALIAALLSSPADPPARDFATRGLDPEAVELGLRARVGDALDAWTIRAVSQDGKHYSLTLRGPGEDEDEHREVELTGRSDEDRSRELASTLATIMEAQSSRSQRPRGFLAVETHLGLGPPRAPDLDLGVGLGGGAWLLRDHLQPRIRVAWSHSWSGALRVNQLGVGLGLAAGAAIERTRGRLWIGGLVMPAFAWTHVEQVRTGTVWSGGGELGALVQYRLPHFVLGVRTGITTTFPAIRALGSPGVIRYGHVRWLLALEIGLGL